MRRLAVLLLLAGYAASAEDGRATRTVRTATTALFVAAQASLALDAMQTLDIKNSCRGDCLLWGRHEMNPLLGQRPSDALIVAYFGGIALAQTALYVWGPSWLSAGTSGVTLAVEVPQIVGNIRVGARFAMPF